MLCDRSGHTALDRAHETGSEEIIALLSKSRSNFRAQNSTNSVLYFGANACALALNDSAVAASGFGGTVVLVGTSTPTP